MAKPVIISTDSTADLPLEVIERLHIVVNHMPITMGGQSYTDGVDVTSQDLFDYFDRTGQLAKTSAQNSTAFLAYFESLTDGGKNAVIHFSISSDMSGSYNFARIAGEEMEDVYCIDSRNLSSGISLLVCMAAELAQAGMEAPEIVKQIEDTIPRVDASFVIDTLEYLYKGGRCSSVAMLGANFLKLKPCIEVQNGQMNVGKKYRGKMESVLKSYIDDRLTDPDNIDRHRCFITHTYNKDKSIPTQLKEYVQSVMNFDEVIENNAGCTISAHCGPGTLGILFIRKHSETSS